MDEQDSLSRRERQIMHVLYAKGQATVSEVQALLEDGPSYSSVRTLIGILETKGFVKHRQDGKRYVYSAIQRPESAGKSALKLVLQTFFAGSVEKAVATILTDDDTKISDEEFRRLAAIVDSARPKAEEAS